MDVVFVVIILGGLFYLYGIPLYRQQQTKEFLVFTLLFGIGFVYSVMMVLDVSPPNPSDWIIKTHQPAFHLLERILPVDRE